MTKRLIPSKALAELAQFRDKKSKTLFRHGSLKAIIFKADGVDRQAPHSQDEIYVVISGSGYFVRGKERHPFVPGEVLFVKAGVKHRFEEFTPDFATWVLFYGPEGGESA